MLHKLNSLPCLSLPPPSLPPPPFLSLSLLLPFSLSLSPSLSFSLSLSLSSPCLYPLTLHNHAAKPGSPGRPANYVVKPKSVPATQRAARRDEESIGGKIKTVAGKAAHFGGEREAVKETSVTVDHKGVVDTQQATGRETAKMNVNSLMQELSEGKYGDFEQNAEEVCCVFCWFTWYCIVLV